MPTDIDDLRRELAEARSEIESLKLSLSNLSLILRKEMTESGKLPKPEEMHQPNPTGIDYYAKFGESAKQS